MRDLPHARTSIASRAQREQETVLQVREVAKSFDSMKAVDGVDLAIARRGTITGVIGPNGAGKVDAVRAHIRLRCSRRAGEIVFEGENHQPACLPTGSFARGLARTFQIPAPLSPVMSVLDNAMLAALDQAGERFLEQLVETARWWPGRKRRSANVPSRS